MVYDLRAALLRKGDTESARLDDFEFRLCARAMRRLAARLGCDSAELVRAVATADDVAILRGLDHSDAEALHAECHAEARAELIRERGDPSPHRLA